MTRPAQRRELAIHAVTEQGVSVALACRAFSISEACYRYVPKLHNENALIADWLIKLTTTKNAGGLVWLFISAM